MLHGRTLDLTLRLPAGRGGNLPLMVSDKGLIQVVVRDDGDHFYRAHYLIQRLQANTLDVEFPAPADTCNPKITLNGVEIFWTRIPKTAMSRVSRPIRKSSVRWLKTLGRAKGCCWLSPTSSLSNSWIMTCAGRHT